MDFKFRNNTEYPIYIVAGMEGKVLTATLYGWQFPGIRHHRGDELVHGDDPRPHHGQLYARQQPRQGEVKLDAAGRKGYRAAAQRTLLQRTAFEVRTEALAIPITVLPARIIPTVPAPISATSRALRPRLPRVRPLPARPPRVLRFQCTSASQAPSQAPSSAAAEEPVSTPAESGGEPVSGAEGQSPSSAPRREPPYERMCLCGYGTEPPCD